MAESDPLLILLAHDKWATEQILGACEKLSDEQFHRRFEMGPGSLHDTLLHVAGAMRTWTDTLAEVELRPRLEAEGRRRTVGELREVFDEVWREYGAQASRRPLSQTVTRTLRNGRTVRMTRGAILAHVATHGMHHRAQCLNMLRHVGVDPLPPSSVTEWTWLGETAG